MNLNSKIEIPLPKRYSHRIKMFFLASAINVLITVTLFMFLVVIGSGANLAFIGVVLYAFYGFLFYVPLVYVICLFIGYQKDHSSNIQNKKQAIGVSFGFAAGILLSSITISPAVTTYQSYFVKDFGGVIFLILFIIAIIEIILFSYIGIKISELIDFLTKGIAIEVKFIVYLVMLLVISLIPLLTLSLRTLNIKNSERKISEGFQIQNIQETDPVLILGGSSLMPRIRTSHTEFVIKADVYVPKEGDYEIWSNFLFVGGSPSKYGEAFHYLQKGWNSVNFFLEWEGCNYDSPFYGRDFEGNESKFPKFKAEFIIMPENRKVYTWNYEIKHTDRKEFLLHCGKQ